MKRVVLIILGVPIALALLTLIPSQSSPPRRYKEEIGAKFIEANGIRFGYFEEGTGPLVLLLHGFPETAHTWDYIRSELARYGFRAVTPFLRGYAPTSTPDDSKDYNPPVLADDALGLITALSPTDKKAYLVGHDWGALIAYAAASKDPAKLRALITVAIPHPGYIKPAPAFLWRGRHFLVLKMPFAEALMRRKDFREVEVLTHRWSTAWNPPDSEFEDVKNLFADPKSLHGALNYYRASKPKPDELFEKKITVPTLAFAGETDGVIATDAFDTAAPGFSGEYKVAKLPGGHFLQRENPAEFLRLLVDFLKRH